MQMMKRRYRYRELMIRAARIDMSPELLITSVVSERSNFYQERRRSRQKPLFPTSRITAGGTEVRDEGGLQETLSRLVNEEADHDAGCDFKSIAQLRTRQSSDSLK